MRQSMPLNDVTNRFGVHAIYLRTQNRTLWDSKAKLLIVVVCLPRPMEGIGRLQFSDLFSQNCQFHHRRLESLEHLMCLIYILLSTTVSHFLDLTDAFFFFFFVYISILQVHFACVLCI